MDEKHLSGEEKRRRMKEQYKKELRERKEFLDKVKGLRRMQSINQALDQMNPEDDTQDWIDKLNQETAFNEARTEMAIESAKLEAEKADEEARFQMSEAEMQKLAAEEMVRKMKEEMEAEARGGLLSVEVTEEGEVTEKEEEADESAHDGPRRGMLDT